MAFDPRFDVVFTGGNPTAANLTASGGEPLLDLQPGHWLVAVCGGDLLPSPNGGGLKCVEWRSIEVVMLKVFYMTAQGSAAALLGHTVTLASISSLFRMAVAGGLSFQPLTSLKTALAELVRVAGPLAQANPAAWTLGLPELQPLPPHTGAAVPAAYTWLAEITYGMLSTMDGAPRGAAVVCALSSARMTPAGRRTNDFKDAMDEVADVVEAARPGWSAKAARPKAMAAASVLMQKVSTMPVHLITCCTGPRAYDLAVSLRYTAQDAFPSYFAMGWQAAYPALAALVLPSTESASALAFAGRLLGETPSPAALDSLEAKVKVLLPHLNTPALRQASAVDRVSAMEPLLRSIRSTASSTAADAADSDPSSTSDTLTWSRVFAMPLTVSFLQALEPLDTVPPIAYRVARAMLLHGSPLGIQLVVGKLNPPHKMIKSMRACASAASATLAIQRTLCVDPGNVLHTEWFPAISEAVCVKLCAGKWRVDAASASSIDLWGEVAAPLLLKQKGAHFLDGHARAAAPAFFASEFELRIGSPIIIDFFATVGVAGTAANSLASVLSTFQGHAATIDAYPARYGAGQTTCRELLISAGQRCFADAAASWVLMLASPLEQATKPAEFAPASSGLHALLAQLRIKMTFIENQIEIDDIRGCASASLSPNSLTESVLSAAPTAHIPVAFPSVLSDTSSLLSAASTLSHGSLALMPSPSEAGFAQPGPTALTGVIGETANPQILISEWGSRTGELRQHMNGYYFGNVFSGPLDPNYSLPANMCPAALCPNRAAQHKFCIYTPGGCTHPPPTGVPLRTFVGNEPTPNNGGAEGKGKGRGAKGARGYGSGVQKPGGRGRGRGAKQQW